MSLGKLLKAGKSLVGGQDATRYQMHKHVRLPKFGSPRNPFAPEPRTEKPVVSPVKVPLETPAPVAGPTPVPAPAPAQRSAGFAVLGKAANDLGTQWSKVNPFARLAKRPGPVRSALPRFGDTLPVQAELSLEKVQVVRNDLSDADLEIVPAAVPAVPVTLEQQPSLLAAAGKHEPDGNAWSRLTTRLFGAGTTT